MEFDCNDDGGKGFADGEGVLLGRTPELVECYVLVGAERVESVAGQIVTELSDAVWKYCMEKAGELGESAVHVTSITVPKTLGMSRLRHQ